MKERTRKENAMEAFEIIETMTPDEILMLIMTCCIELFKRDTPESRDYPQERLTDTGVEIALGFIKDIKKLHVEAQN